MFGGNKDEGAVLILPFLKDPDVSHQLNMHFETVGPMLFLDSDEGFITRDEIEASYQLRK